MCMQQSRACQCGRHTAHLNFYDNILTPEILVGLYCPECRHQVAWDGACMVEDCGWIMEYDLEGARFLLEQRGVRAEVTPEFLFDEGYLSWQGFSPHDLEVNAALHQRLQPLSKEDLPRYLKTLREEWLAYVEGLKAAGWRKTQRA